MQHMEGRPKRKPELSQCRREHQSEKGKCPFCSAPRRLVNRQKEKPNESGCSAYPNSLGVCPQCVQTVPGFGCSSLTNHMSRGGHLRMGERLGASSHYHGLVSINPEL